MLNPYNPDGSLKKGKAIIIDLDGTLCNNQHRKHFAEKKDWESFAKEIPKDTINSWCREIIFTFQNAGYESIFVTGREGTRQVQQDTFEWLRRHNIDPLPIHFRNVGDHRHDYIIKQEIYDNEIKPFFDILFAVDDRQQVVDMWRAHGIPCLQCAKGDF